LVRFKSTPAVVPPVIMDALMSQSDEGNCVDLSRPSYLPNQRVRIVEGPFQGYEAIFASHRGEDRVVVLFTMMQQHQHLVLPETAIEPA
ncbi:MAG: transcription/translation regulatory transformer protein RfaH, partial [Pseudomonadales bacterium]|nr:transcription/translation regulatory transformer protein RfaH [Pseudomonadales bacterium]